MGSLHIYKTKIESRIKGAAQEKLQSVLGEMVRELGFSDFDFSILRTSRISGARQFLWSSLGKTIEEYYLEQISAHDDITVAYVLVNSQPILHSALYRALLDLPYTKWTVKNRQFRDKLSSLGYHDYLSVPVHDNKDTCQMALLSVFIKGASSLDLQRHAKLYLSQLQIIANAGYKFGYLRFHQRKAVSSIPGLTRREREVLQKCAVHGVYPARIAQMMCISERTVEKHMENIRTKLDFESTYLAIIEGLRSGLID